MKFYNALSDFLYDKNYFITLFDNKVHIYRYLEIEKLTMEKIIVVMNGFKLTISGRDLIVLQMNSEEIILQGQIIEIGKVYE